MERYSCCLCNSGNREAILVYTNIRIDVGSGARLGPLGPLGEESVLELVRECIRTQGDTTKTQRASYYDS